MPFKKGDKKLPNSGKGKGTPNKLTKTVKEAFVEAFGAMQLKQDVNLLEWGNSNPTEFYKLCSKLIPTAVEAKIEGGVTIKQVFKIGETEIEL